MGVGASDLSTTTEKKTLMRQPSLSDVPESCISSILMCFDPPEICKLAGLNRSFRAASTADFVWETKLPSNYKYLITKVFGVDVGSGDERLRLSKKDVYAMLCRPNRFDGGTKEVWLDKSSGKVCMLISAKAMKITGIDDRRYWNYIPTDESRFQVVAYLQQIWWFEVVGEIDFQFPLGSYSLLFRLHQGKASKRFGRRICNVDQVHGWDIKPVRFQLWTSNGQHSSSEYSLWEPAGTWVHYHVGDFVIDKANCSTKIRFCMMQIDCTHTKGGLCLDSVLICPSEFRDRLK